MSDFFDKNFAQGIVSGIVVLLIGFMFNRGSGASSTGKGWKVTVMIAYVMIFCGFFLFLKSFPNGEFNNPYTGMGFSSFFLGLILRAIGRFFVWWHR